MKIEFDTWAKGKACLLVEFKYIYSFNGKKCKTCGLVQGLPNDKLGIVKFYCDHIYNKVNRKMKPYRDKLYSEIINEISNEIEKYRKDKTEVKK